MDSIEANVVVAVSKDVILCMNLELNKCRGQCYNGASNMAGNRNGTATEILKDEPRAVYTHCYGHALNLAACDTVWSNKILRDTLHTTNEISKLLKFSPRRDTLFEKIKSEISPELLGFRTLCPTQWTVKADSLCSVINNYSVFQEFWEKAKDIISDSETRARIAGVEAYMSKCEYKFGLVLGVCVLRHTDNLSKTLQSPKLNASEGQRIAELTCLTLERIRTNECCDEFWEMVLQLARKHDINEPTLPRKRKAPARYEVGSEDGYFHDSHKIILKFLILC